MGKANLRTMLEGFSDNVKSGIPTSLTFSPSLRKGGGAMLALTADGAEAKVGMTTDLTDDTVYSLNGDDIETVAEEMDEHLTEAEVVHVQKGIEAGFGSSWHDIIESAIQDVVMSRRES